jgi:hypothetical protein
VVALAETYRRRAGARRTALVCHSGMRQRFGARSACHAGAPGGPFINIKFHGSPFANGARGRPLPTLVGVPGTGKGFGHEKSSICVSDRCHHRCHCLGDTITSSSVAGWLGSRPRRRTNCWRGDRWHSVERLRLWPGVRLLWRLCPCLLRRVRPSVLQLRLRSRLLWSSVSASIRILRWPSVLSRVSLRLVIARRDAEVQTTKVAEMSATFFSADLGVVMTRDEN